MGTLKKRIEQPHEIDDPGVVQVVTDHLGNAIYFSRSPIRIIETACRNDRVLQNPSGWSFIGRDFLLAYPDLPPGPSDRRVPGQLRAARKTDFGFGLWKRSMNRWASTRRDWRMSRPYTKK